MSGSALFTPVITVTDGATPELKRQVAELGGTRGTAAMGQACAQLIKRWLIQRNARPNEKGFPKSNFYGRAAEKTFWIANEVRAEIHIALEGFAQRVYGGTIKPVNAGALTIPVVPEAYNKRAREFPDLVFVPLQNPGNAFGFLMRPIEGKAFGVVMYLLVKQVTQVGDPTVLPDGKDILDTAITALERIAKRQ